MYGFFLSLNDLLIFCPPFPHFLYYHSIELGFPKELKEVGLQIPLDFSGTWPPDSRSTSRQVHICVSLETNSGGT